MSFAAQKGANRVPQPKKHLTVAPTIKGDRAAPLPAQTQLSPLALPWLKSLLLAQRGTSILCFILVGGLLSVYTWTVYTQMLWTREYRKLENLQRRERQMTAANEVLKNSLADSAALPESGLLPTSIANSIFIAPAPQRRFLPVKPAIVPEPKKPLGY